MSVPSITGNTITKDRGVVVELEAVPSLRQEVEMSEDGLFEQGRSVS